MDLGNNNPKKSYVTGDPTDSGYNPRPNGFV